MLDRDVLGCQHMKGVTMNAITCALVGIGFAVLGTIPNEGWSLWLCQFIAAYTLTIALFVAIWKGVTK